MLNVLVIIVFIICFLAIILVIPTLMTRRAMNQVLKIFRHYGALDEASAMTIESLGLAPLSFAQRIMKPRDYKPRAIEFLKKLEAIQTTSEGKIFLSRDKLLASGIKQNIFQRLS
jgi:hypothetical protein